jgi:type I restriction enzyme R subunit
MRKFIDMPGKGLIVCATREICAKLYEEIIALRPEWHSDDVRKGKIKVVYTGAPGDPAPIRKHVRRPSQNKLIQHRARSEDPDEELELVIVQSMWLTGFDSPPLHTLYVDRPMRGAALMQALARVNRTFRGKKDGLLVGYAPLTMYSARWKPSPTCGRRRPTGDKSAAAALSGLEAAARVGGAWRRRPPRESGGPLPRPAGP